MSRVNASELLRRARSASGLNQRDYAARVGVRQPVISAYENGRREPALSTLDRLVRGSGLRIRVDLVPPTTDLPPAADAAEHAERLLDVLSLVDAIPRYRTGELTMPRMESRRAAR